jgi:hypothetical protein
LRAGIEALAWKVGAVLVRRVALAPPDQLDARIAIVAQRQAGSRPQPGEPRLRSGRPDEHEHVIADQDLERRILGLERSCDRLDGHPVDSLQVAARRDVRDPRKLALARL